MRMIPHKQAGKKAMFALAALACLAGPMTHRMDAAERVILSNGFDLVCNHHEVVGGHIRIYLKAGKPDYFELEPDAVTGYETAPDPPVEVKSDTNAAAKPAGPAPAARLSAAELHQLLKKAGTEHNVDEDLLASVVKAESDGQVRATSRAGAQGLMQLMPGTAKKLGVANSFEPGENVRGGTAYLDAMLTRYHDNIALALAAYNAGPEAVDRYHGIPPYRETRLYVARVMHEFNRRLAARQRMAESALVASSKAMSSAETGSE